MPGPRARLRPRPPRHHDVGGEGRAAAGARATHGAVHARPAGCRRTQERRQARRRRVRARAAGVDGPVTGRSRPAGGPAARLHHVRGRARDPAARGPGSGKTLLARAVAREWGLPLLKMEPARLYDKYIGETEKNLDKALRMAEQMAPCVLMIDELEKGLSYNQRRRAQGDLRGPSTQAEARPEGHEAAVGHTRGDHRRAARVGARSHGDRELARIEDRDGTAGAVRALGGLGGHVGAPHVHSFRLTAFALRNGYACAAPAQSRLTTHASPSNRRSVRFSQVMRPRHDRSSWRRRGRSKIEV